MVLQSLGPSKPGAIEQFEARLGFSLPPDYKQFLTETNGAQIINGVLHVTELHEAIRIDLLFGLNLEQRGLNLEFWHKEYFNELPKVSLLIGKEAGGGLILLINNGQDDGIYYYDHTYSFIQSSDQKNTYFLAESFSKFIHMLQEDDRCCS